MNRRHLITVAAMLPIGWVVGCTTAQLSQVETDATAIANGLAGILPSISTITGLAGGALNTVKSAIAAVQSAASTLATATGGAAVTAAKAIPTALATISSALSNFNVPTWVTTVIAAAQTIVPIILSTVGAVSGGLAATAPPNTGMTVAQARAILQAAAAQAMGGTKAVA